MSKADIWMPLYIGDYLADTMRLTTEQHGAYLLLLMEYWRCGSLPDDDDELSAITKLPPESWSRQRGKIARFFVIENGFWIQKRAEEEMAAAEKRRIAASKNGKKGGRPRGQSKAKQKPKETHSFPENNPEETHSFNSAFENGGFQKAKQKPGESSLSLPSPLPIKTSLPEGTDVGVENNLGGEVRWGKIE